MNKITKGVAAAALTAALLIPAGVRAAEGSTDEVMTNLPFYEVSTLSGTGSLGVKDGDNLTATYRKPVAVQARADGTLLIADSGNQLIRTVSDTMTGTAAGVVFGVDDYGFLSGSFLDGAADRAAFNTPSGLSVDGQGNTVIADADNNAVRSLSQAGKVTTIAGNGMPGYADGTGTEALFDHPLDAVVSKSGIIYVADTLNNVIRQIQNGKVTTLTAPSTRIIEYFPGEVEAVGDFADGPLASAKFNEPSGIAIDTKGNLYVSDTGNQLIRYIDLAKGTVTTAAGSPSVVYEENDAYAAGDYKDGKASEARFHSPHGLAVTPDGGVLIADSLNQTIRYLKDDKVYTVAGTAGETNSKDGLSVYAGLDFPTDVTWVGNGSFAIADSGNNRIRIVQPYQRPAGLKADGKIHLLYQSTILKTDAEPIIKNGITFVPVRVIGEQLGYNVQNTGKGKAALTAGSSTYSLQAGSSTASFSETGKAPVDVKLGASPFISSNRLYLPVRFFAEQIGLDVKWLSGSKSVLLRDKLK